MIVWKGPGFIVMDKKFSVPVGWDHGMSIGTPMVYTDAKTAEGLRGDPEHGEIVEVEITMVKKVKPDGAAS